MNGHRTSISGSGALAVMRRRAAWQQQCVTPIHTAVEIANGTLLPRSSSARPTPMPRTKYSGRHYFSEWLHPQMPQPLDCIVYSFGVSTADEFTFFWSTQGCQVYAFDPTVSHPTNWLPNVTFHPWGLRSTTERADEKNSTIGEYAAVGGELMTLAEIMRRLGHNRHTRLHAMKLDCEGCEYLTFEELYCMGDHAPRIDSISVELHFWVTLRMEQWEDLERIRFVALYLRSHPFETFQFASHRGAVVPYRGENAFTHPDLVHAGLPPTDCCFMYGAVRSDVWHGGHRAHAQVLV